MEDINALTEQMLKGPDCAKQLLGIRSLLCKKFVQIYIIDIRTKKAHAFLKEGQLFSVPEHGDFKLDYEAEVSSYIQHTVLSEDRSKINFLMDLNMVVDRLRQAEEFGISYRAKLNGEMHYYYALCARVGEAESFEAFVLGFANEDADIKRGEIELDLSYENEGQKRKILIVEDNEMNQEILNDLLCDEYEIIKATDGEEGLHLLAETYQELSAILLDVYMPNCDGFEFLKRQGEDRMLSAVPTIVMTGSENNDDEAECLKLGAIDFIKKPYNAQIVKSRINGVVRLRESAATLAAVEYDELTGIYTRAAFLHHAAILLNTKSEEKFHVIVGDVRNFKMINSIYGAKMGDEILTYLAGRYRENTRFGGMASRYGSDQFVCLVYGDFDLSYETFSVRAEEIDRHAPIANLVVKYGVYENVDASLPIPIIVDRAFAAMKSIHNEYGNNIAYYTDEMTQSQVRRNLMENAFDDAIANKEFFVMYQPKYQAKSEKIVGAEALVRWKKLDGTIVSPGEFIPLFEENGMIRRLDEYVFSEVSRVQSERKQNGEKVVPISVNLSRAALHNEKTIESYISIVKKNEIDFDDVPIELTETAAMQSMEIKGMTERMLEAGFTLHMDDFGTGYSSIMSLNALPFKVIKLDKSLIDYVDSEKGRQTIHHIIALAHSLNMKVLCEGVETKEQVEFLRENDCDEIQGYYYSKPQMYEDFKRMVAEQEKG